MRSHEKARESWLNLDFKAISLAAVGKGDLIGKSTMI